jgi:hypothetical protein
MKKSLLFSVFVSACALSSIAQSDYKILDLGNNDITNTTIQVYGAPGSSYTGTYNVKNINANNLSSKARKEEISMAGSGASSSICFGGACFAPSTYVSPCKIDSAGRSLVLNGDFTFGTSMTPSTIRYTVYSCASASDSSSFTVVYNPSPAGIATYAMNYSMSEPYPNPTSSSLSFDYKLGNSFGNPQVMVYNLLGSLVKTVDLSETAGTIKLDVTDLDAGMYFYTLQLNGKPVTSKKFIVRH